MYFNLILGNDGDVYLLVCDEKCKGKLLNLYDPSAKDYSIITQPKNKMVSKSRYRSITYSYLRKNLLFNMKMYFNDIWTIF